MIHYVLSKNKQNSSYIDNLPSTFNISDLQSDYAKPLTEIREGDLYFCLEERTVCVSGQEIELTAKEFYIWIEKSIVAVLLIDTVALIGILIVGITKVSLGHSPAFKSYIKNFISASGFSKAAGIEVEAEPERLFSGSICSIGCLFGNSRV